MDLEKLQETVNQMKTMQHFGTTDTDLVRHLLEFLYKGYDGSLMQIFLWIDEMEKETQRKKDMILYGGLEDAMHLASNYSASAEHPKEMKSLDKLVFDPDDGNIAFIIRIAMAYFPSGTADGASFAGEDFFNKFVALILKHQSKYLTGDSKEWAQRYDYYDYIKLVVEKNS